MTKTIENFLRYARIDTQSADDMDQVPSTSRQHELAKLLTEELKSIGAEGVTYDREHCYVYAYIPATTGFEEAPALGFIAHMDTSPAVTDTNVCPRIIEDYDGNDITLNEALNVVMKVSDFPELAELKGKDLIVTDGTTLLGADDKAGVAEIMAAAEYLLSHPEISHGKVCIGFTPDEEVGRGPDFFDLKQFGADFAYTVDGGALGELEYETFNAAGAKLCIKGRSVHPGSAKGKMINALLIAMEFQRLLPEFENPMYTEKYEGFFHLDDMVGNVEECTCSYIIRDHDRAAFEKKKAFFLSCADFINTKYGDGCASVTMKDSYYNMSEILISHMHLINNAKKAMEELSVEPKVCPIRGGTDGARLSFLGLPCPNLCTGGANFHGKYEYACVQSMEKTTEILLKLIEIYAGVRSGTSVS